MTNYRYLPFLLIKHLTISDGDYNLIQKVGNFSDLSRQMNVTQLEKFYDEEYKSEKSKLNIISLDKAKSIDLEMVNIAILPWFYDCNRLRYPSWQFKPDSRLE